jgi:hypothetical protein
MALYTMLNMPTGKSLANALHFKKTGISGLEHYEWTRDLDGQPEIFKNPFVTLHPRIVNHVATHCNATVNCQLIVPVWEIYLMAASRMDNYNHHTRIGGMLVKSKNFEDKLYFKASAFSGFIVKLVKYEAQYTLLYFARLIEDEKYLYSKLKWLFDKYTVDEGKVLKQFFILNENHTASKHEDVELLSNENRGPLKVYNICSLLLQWWKIFFYIIFTYF